MKDGLNLNELFEISFKYKSDNGDNNLKISLFGKINNDIFYGLFDIEKFKGYDIYNYIGEPFETITIEQISDKYKHHKCLTFFSYAQKEWKNFQA